MEIPIFNSIFDKTTESYKKNKDINFQNLNGKILLNHLIKNFSIT